MGGLRCWPGCLAIVVKSEAGFAGATVKCVRLHNSHTHDLDGVLIQNLGPRWVIERPLRYPGSTWSLYTVADCRLRPIVPPPGSDITTTDDTAPCEVEHGIAHA